MLLIFFFKQKTEYEMRISDWSSDVCSSDLRLSWGRGAWSREKMSSMLSAATPASSRAMVSRWPAALASGSRLSSSSARSRPSIAAPPASKERLPKVIRPDRSEEHTSELQSLMRISYAVFCLKKKNNNKYVVIYRL